MVFQLRHWIGSSGDLGSGLGSATVFLCDPEPFLPQFLSFPTDLQPLQKAQLCLFSVPWKLLSLVLLSVSMTTTGGISGTVLTDGPLTCSVVCWFLPIPLGGGVCAESIIHRTAVHICASYTNNWLGLVSRQSTSGLEHHLMGILELPNGLMGMCPGFFILVKPTCLLWDMWNIFWVGGKNAAPKKPSHSL